jgi:antitoxin (DNA-binding transcriptional repressor) of toxin-antitoxin stability system
MPSLNIRQLRDTRRLKAWLEQGETIELRERNRPIGRIVPEKVFSALQERFATPAPAGEDHLVEDLLEIGRCTARLPILEAGTPEELLYDEHGAPK